MIRSPRTAAVSVSSDRFWPRSKGTDGGPLVRATIVGSIRRHARGDPEALASNIILDLADAGYAISRAPALEPCGVLGCNVSE
jgi:hypothetical protein